MREFVMYALDESGAVKSTDYFIGMTEAAVRSFATKQLKKSACVEVWEGKVCILRRKRSRQ